MLIESLKLTPRPRRRPTPSSAMSATPPTLRRDSPETLDFGRAIQNLCPQNERPVPRRAYRGWAMIQITQHTDGSAYARACEGPEVHAHIPGLDEPEVNAQMHGLDIREDQHKGASQTSQPQKESFIDRQLSSSVRSTDLFHGLSAVGVGGTYSPGSHLVGPRGAIQGAPPAPPGGF